MRTLALLFLAGCAGAPEPVVIAQKPIAPPQVIVDASAPVVVHPPPMEKLHAALGDLPIDGTPLLVQGETWFAVIGDARISRATALITLGDKPAVKTDALLPGVHVLRAAVALDRVQIVVETLAVLDQPAGMRSLFSIGLGKPSAGFVMTPAAIEIATRNPSDLAHEVEIHKTIEDYKAYERTPVLSEPAMLARAHGPFLEKTGAVQPNDARFAAMLANTHCSSGHFCESRESDGTRVVVWYEDKNGEHVANVIALEPPLAPLVNPAPPRVIASSPDAKKTTAAIHSIGGRGQGIAEAPSGSTGFVGVTDANQVVFSDGDYLEAQELYLSGGASMEITFGDFDGDGRTDVLTFSKNVRDKRSAARLFIAPRRVGTQLLPDPGAVLSLLDVHSMKEAVAAALAMPRGGVTKKEACSAIAEAYKKKSFEKIVRYEEPSLPEIWKSMKPEKLYANGPWDCVSLRCEPDRPVCFVRDEPSQHYFYFTRDKKGAVKATAAIIHSGP